MTCGKTGAMIREPFKAVFLYYHFGQPADHWILNIIFIVSGIGVPLELLYFGSLSREVEVYR